MMRKFQVADVPIINAWYALRGMAPLSEHLFPEVGFIVDGVGAGFIYQTDSSLCFLDGFIANPKTTQEQRREAFDLISTALILAAKDHGFDQILAYTKNREIRARCGRFNFQPKGEYTLFVKEL